MEVEGAGGGETIVSLKLVQKPKVICLLIYIYFKHLNLM